MKIITWGLTDQLLDYKLELLCHVSNNRLLWKLDRQKQSDRDSMGEAAMTGGDHSCSATKTKAASCFVQVRHCIIIFPTFTHTHEHTPLSPLTSASSVSWSQIPADSSQSVRGDRWWPRPSSGRFQEENIGRTEDGNIRWICADLSSKQLKYFIKALPERGARLLYLLLAVISGHRWWKMRPSWKKGEGLEPL